MELTKTYPSIKIIALSDTQTGFAIKKAITNGACSFLNKDAGPHELKTKLDKVMQSGFCASGKHASLLRKLLLPSNYSSNDLTITLCDKEIDFLQMCGTKLSYIDMAGELKVSENVVEPFKGRFICKA